MGINKNNESADKTKEETKETINVPEDKLDEDA